MSNYPQPIKLQNPNRLWPNKEITQAPTWCSVDLRDGNQSIPNPMGIAAKTQFFTMLCEIGFKEIEIGFPAASNTEYEFCRQLITKDLIPEDVTVQVLVQARENLIEKTFEALKGSRRAIVHVYNSTSPAQRKYVFQSDKQEIINIATSAASLISKLAKENPETAWTLQYSPESFSQTEIPFALEICNHVGNIWKDQFPIIINLPATVESSLPNVYADQIELMCNHLNFPCKVSLHTHNDRGCAIAATELALLAGATRVEGTLFGNGERTGNADIVTLALNMLSHGVDPNLDFSNLPKIKDIYEELTAMTVPVRQPYAGELVFTAFSGSHQDAIAKSLKQVGEVWDVPYIPINPNDIGRNYEPVRINSQSGKGGVGFILERDLGNLPKEVVLEFSKIIKEKSDSSQTELQPGTILNLFSDVYSRQTPIQFVECFNNHNQYSFKMFDTGQIIELTSVGEGPIEAATKSLTKHLKEDFVVTHYSERALSIGEDATAFCIVSVNHTFGIGFSKNIETAALKALVAAINRILSKKSLLVV